MLPSQRLSILICRFESTHAKIAKICGEETAARVGPLWDFNAEGELQNVWRYLGVPNLWFMLGAFPSSPAC